MSTQPKPEPQKIKKSLVGSMFEELQKKNEGSSDIKSKTPIVSVGKKFGSDNHPSTSTTNSTTITSKSDENLVNPKSESSDGKVIKGQESNSSVDQAELEAQKEKEILQTDGVSKVRLCLHIDCQKRTLVV